MNSYKEIENLIEKYYNGDTSLEEEAQLQTFFSGEDVPDHLKSYKPWFSQLKIRSEVAWGGFSEDNLFAKLDEQVENTEPKMVEMPRQSNAKVWFYRVAAAAVLILVGFYVGQQNNANDDVENMRAELKEMKQLMISQMTESSASARLQAVSSSFQFSSADKETLNALIKVLNHDENMNVRLKAIEALTRFGDSPKAKQALLNALAEEKEPMVQIGLIDALVDLKEKRAIDDLERIATDGNSLKGVKDEAHMGLFKLREM